MILLPVEDAGSLNDRPGAIAPRLLRAPPTKTVVLRLPELDVLPHQLNKSMNTCRIWPKIIHRLPYWIPGLCSPMQRAMPSPQNSRICYTQTTRDIPCGQLRSDHCWRLLGLLKRLGISFNWRRDLSRCLTEEILMDGDFET